MNETSRAEVAPRVVGRFNPVREVLPNGIVLLWHYRPEPAFVAIRGSIPAGACWDPAGKDGLAEITAQLLRFGAAGATAEMISDAIEGLGAGVQVWAGIESAGFSGRCLGRDQGALLSMLRTLLEHPTFPENELGRLRANNLTRLKERDDQPRAVAGLLMQELLYPPGHPYARDVSGVAETIEGLRREDCTAFHREHFGAEGMIVSLCGALDVELVRRELGTWYCNRAGEPPPGFPEPAAACPLPAPRRETRAMPRKSQVHVSVGGVGISRSHEDYYALGQAGMVLGGIGLMGRLGQAIRENDGIAYDAGFRASSRRWGGDWIASAGVEPNNTERVIVRMQQEIARMREELVEEEELADVQSSLIGSLRFRLETAEGVASHMLTVEYLGLGLDYFDRYPALVRSHTRQALRDAFRRHVDPERAAIVLAGPVGKGGAPGAHGV
jgi:zinc protease